MPSGQYKIVPDFSITPGKPSPRPALRDGVVCRGSPKAPLLLPAPFSSPVFPLSRRCGVLPVPAAHPAHRPRQGGFGAGRGGDATRVGKPAQTASQGQTAGNSPGGPLGPLAFLSHLHFRSIFLLCSFLLCQPLCTVPWSGPASRRLLLIFY